jgi:sulfide dehydrogenase [flavocytochrome c] flavoprotein subunit
MKRYSRRQTLVMSSALVPGSLLAGATRATGKARVVVVGGGFGGASAARTLHRIAPEMDVTLIVDADRFSTCPFSNLVIAGEIPLSQITFGYDKLAAEGVKVLQGRAVEVDAARKVIRLEDGRDLAFDRAILSPGIDLKFTAIPGYNAAAADKMPHAWKAGEQTILLRDQIAAMPQGGTFVMTVPNNPYRCPPGPYERASLVAFSLSKTNPTARILIIDGKDSFSKQSLFKEGWEHLYPGMITHVPFAENGGVLEVVPETLEVVTAFETFKGDVVNVIPPQSAAEVALNSGLAAGGDWCQIDQATFESPHAPGVHVLGDAAIVGDMPKSGFSASVQGSVCAHVVAALLRDEDVPGGVLLNTCYSFVAPDYGISVAGVYRVTEDGKLAATKGAGGTSPVGAGDEVRLSEADFARSWYATLTGNLFL